MPDLLLFTFRTTPVPVRLDQEGNPLWKAADIGRALDYAGDMGQRIQRLDDDERTLISNEGGGSAWWITEAGLYALILGSRKPEARAFKRWLTHEVLPKIRQTGAYTPDTPDAALEHYPELKALAAQARTVIALVASTAEARHMAECAQVNALSAKTMAQQALDSQQWVTVREYCFLNMLDRQMPASYQQEYGRYLTGYCLEHGIPIRNQGIADRQYSSEHAYHVGTIEKTFTQWLLRRTGQTTLTVLPGGEGLTQDPGVAYTRGRRGRR